MTRIRWSVALALVACLAPGQVPNARMAAPWISGLGYQPSEIFPVSIGRFGYPYLQVMVNGQAVNLPFDTGNMARLVFSQAEAQSRGLGLLGKIRAGR